MSEGAITTIGELLVRWPEITPNAFIFAQAGHLRLGSKALIDRDGLYDPDHVPELARSHNLSYLMMAEIYNDIAENIRLQIASPSIDQRFEALAFYVENDAFKVW